MVGCGRTAPPFWLSLIPFAAGWVGDSSFRPVPVALWPLHLLAPALLRMVKALIAAPTMPRRGRRPRP